MLIKKPKVDDKRKKFHRWKNQSNKFIIRKFLNWKKLFLTIKNNENSNTKILKMILCTLILSNLKIKFQKKKYNK